jgi:hypothetical protein
MRLRTRPRTQASVRALVVLGAVGALLIGMLAALAGPSVARVPSGDTDSKQATATDPSVRQASHALRRAESIREDGAAGRDATMVLRDLANTRADLPDAERAAADALMKRPTSSGGDGYLNYGSVEEETPVCTATLCVHYVTSGQHASTPEYVATAVDTLTSVQQAYLTSGYRAVKSDGGLGGNSLPDVYLGNIGVNGLYGYCTSDDPSRSTQRWDRWAYCVLDNDYSASEFPTNTPTENLQVTAAHEYFHAIQYAYDRYEDSWLLEATAACVEDELYDGVDDNLQYLRSSQLRSPGTPLDTFDPSTGFHYGTWSFFRFLSERFPEKKGLLPRIVLDVFSKADGGPGGPDQYSWKAVNSVLKKRKTSGAAMLGAYAVANRRPGQSYDEGAANRYPKAPAGKVTLAAGKTRTVKVRLDHLTSRTTRLTPKRLATKKAKVRLTFDLSPRATGAFALITTTLRSGKVRTVKVKLNKKGNGAKAVPFSSRKVDNVEVTLVNGSGRFKCWQQSYFSCQGRPLDDNAAQQFTARAVKR